MSKDMNRRDFLKTAAVTGTVFLAGDIFQSRAFAQGSVKIPEAEKIVITVITDNYADALRPDYKIAKRHAATTSVLEGALHAEHGLAYHVETTVDGRTHSFLKVAYHVGHNSCTSGTGNGALCHEGRVLLATALALMPKISDAYLCPI